MPKQSFIENAGPLVQLTWSRVLEFVRSPATIFWVFGFPLVLALVLGFAFRNSVPEKVRIAVLGEGESVVVSDLAKAPRIQVVRLPQEDAAAAIRSGKVDLLVITTKDSHAVSYRYDAQREESVTARMMVDDAIQRANGRTDPVATSIQQVTEPGGRYIEFLIPGLIGLNIMGSCMWGIGYAVVDTRRRKLLKRFAATPMHRSHFLLSFMFSRLVFLIAEVAILVLFGYWVFGVSIHGSVVGLGLAALLGAFAFSGIAVMIGARPDNTEIASGWMNFVMLPMWLLSGSFFSYERFPEMLQSVIRFLPLTALNDSLRGAMTDGYGLVQLSLPLAILAIWGFLGFAVALRIFKWQ